MSFGYIPDFRGKSIFRDLYLKLFGYPYAPRRNEARLVFKLLEPARVTNILDIGSGDGVWTNDLAKKRLNVIGLDLKCSDIATAYSRAKELGSNSQYVVGDAQIMPFADEVFDQCYAISVFEHIPDDTKVFSETYRILKPGGVLILSVPSYRLPLIMRMVARFPQRWKNLFASEITRNSKNYEELKNHADIRFKHVRRYDNESLILKTKEAGFGLSILEYNLKFFGDLVNGIIHSLRIFEFEKRNGYRNRGEIWYAISFPFVYLLHKLDDLLPIKGCTIVAKFYKSQEE